eukprot:XP_014041922.1 PREDICTED: cilia- and flagella-associated protein 70-like [Salmo salar]
MCGILAEMGGRLEEAETFFEGATCVDPANVVAWTLFGLFYEGQENSIQTVMAFLEATKQQRAALVVTPPCRVETSVESPDLGEEEQEVVNCESLTIKPDVDGDTEASVVTGSQSCQDSKPGEGYKGGAEAEPSAMRHLATPTRLNTTIYMETVQFLLQNNALQMAQRALAQELLCPEGGLSSSYHLALARLQLLRAEYGSAESSLKEALHDSF